ncbi:hypothetical protein BD410DRAFT_808452 [Rickenella mellea]|uniref:Uncharacterized protein n=1 Tax=Rickenella mellea TaxID=50990 RepID=A0A4Y7PKL2_9AGAM|nr:hypothetical protein BD410DRAFT_808452 [Rickenella mellea]
MVLCPIPSLNSPQKLPSNEVAAIPRKNPKDGWYTQHTLAAGGLSASIASQLMSTITTESPIVGGIAHAILSVTCIMGLATFIMHASPHRDSSVNASVVLGYSSVWFATIGIVVLTWAIQPEPVAIAVTVVFVIVALAMVACSVYPQARNPKPEQNVVYEYNLMTFNLSDPVTKDGQSTIFSTLGK